MSRRVLLADDDPISRHMVTEWLTAWGHEVVAVEDGQTAWVELQKEDAPRLAVVDWVMPGMDGIALIQQLRAYRRDPYTHVLLLTAKSETRDILQGLGAGADDYLVKPFNVQELEARLQVGERILEREEARASATALRFEAVHDALTGVYTRTAVLDALRRELARTSRKNGDVAVIAVELDQMEKIIERHGYLVADAALRRVAHLIKTAVRDYDAVGKLGAAQFLLVLPNYEIEDVSKLTQSITRSIANAPIAIGQPSSRVTVSVGAICVHENADLESAVEAVDAALRMAKNRESKR